MILTVGPIWFTIGIRVTLFLKYRRTQNWTQGEKLHNSKYLIKIVKNHFYTKIDSRVSYRNR